MSVDRDLAQELRALRVPGEDEAEQRSLELVRAAYAEREPSPARRSSGRIALAIAGGVAVLAIGLSPAGAKVADLVSDVISPDPGAENAKPELRALPVAGEILVESEQGPWIVREDGSKRLLGDYDEATWSPRGLFVAVTDGRELIAVDPLGEVRWTITAPGRVTGPRWSPSGFRIAYRSRGDLWVVAGDGTDARVVARNVAPVAAAWRPIGDSKLAPAPGAPGSNVLTYAGANGGIRTIDVDTGARMRTTAEDLQLLSTPSVGRDGQAASPDGTRIAAIERVKRRDQLVLQGEGGGAKRILFSARGTLTGPTWSPDGRWLLVGWPAADQWLLISVEGSDRVVAFDRISEQFDPGASGESSFPRVAGWVLPER
jgi:dipeptidyl aminopeptidase/acylaminoacyl peptidase